MENKIDTKSYSEVLEILKYIPKLDYDKIPKDVVYKIRKKAKVKSEYKYNEGLPVKYQNISSETLDIMAILYKKYMASDTEKAKIEIFDAMRRKEIEEERIKKYNPDDIFRKVQLEEKRESVEKLTEPNILPARAKRESFGYRIVKMIKRIFNIK